MADDAVNAGTVVEATWFSIIDHEARLHRSWSDGRTAPISPFVVVDELAQVDVAVTDAHPRQIALLRSLSAYTGPRTEEAEKLVCMAAKLVVSGYQINQDVAFVLQQVLLKTDRTLVDALSSGDDGFRDILPAWWNRAQTEALRRTWFRVDGMKTSPVTMGEDGVIRDLSPAALIDRFRESSDFLADGYQEYGRPYANAAKAGLTLRAEAEPALLAISGLYAFGAAIHENELSALERTLAKASREELEIFTADDAWLRNFVLNVWEYARGERELTTYPWNISLPIADICNARCTFCTAWIDGKALVKLKQIEAFEDVLRRSVYIGLVGHGEPLAHPQFDKICEMIAQWIDPRAQTYTITNGVYLKKWEHLLDAINLRSFSISLNAATARTHHEVMGLGEDALTGILESLRKLCEKGPDGRPKRNVSITMVVTQQNVHEIPEFIRLGEELGVTQVWLRSLLPQTHLTPGLNYHILPAYLHPDFARVKEEALAAIASAKVPVVADPASWDAPVFPPQLQSEIDRKPPEIMTREQALRDKELRSRTAEVYTADSFKRRGRPLSSKEFTRVEFMEGRTLVETKAGAWQYALTLRLPLPEGASGLARITTPVSDVTGKLGFGVWDDGRNEWVVRCGMESDGEAVLEFDAANPNLTFVVENWSTDGVSSKGVLSAPRLEIDGRPAGELRLADATLYNAIDPFEDGSNPFDRSPRFACKAVYYNLYVNEMYMRVVPCCYMTHVAGFEEIRFDGTTPFLEIWNAPAMVELRRRLKDGPLFGACRKCPEKW